MCIVCCCRSVRLGVRTGLGISLGLFGIVASFLRSCSLSFGTLPLFLGLLIILIFLALIIQRVGRGLGGIKLLLRVVALRH